MFSDDPPPVSRRRPATRNSDRYTGHCPTLKFQIGKRYGANVREIMQERKDKKPVLNGVATVGDIQHAATRPPKLSSPNHKPHNQNREYRRDVTQNRGRRFILGYTGFIPGLNFRYGKSYVRAADDCMAEFGQRLIEQKMRYETERRARSAPQMMPRYQNGTARDRSLSRNPVDHHISSDSPPIAGYTGHIPRLRNTDVSISQRYSSAARSSLEQLKRQREERQQSTKVQKELAKNLEEVIERTKRIK